MRSSVVKRPVCCWDTQRRFLPPGVSESRRNMSTHAASLFGGPSTCCRGWKHQNSDIPDWRTTCSVWMQPGASEYCRQSAVDCAQVECSQVQAKVAETHIPVERRQARRTLPTPGHVCSNTHLIHPTSHRKCTQMVFSHVVSHRKFQFFFLRGAAKGSISSVFTLSNGQPPTQLVTVYALKEIPWMTVYSQTAQSRTSPSQSMTRSCSSTSAGPQ